METISANIELARAIPMAGKYIARGEKIFSSGSKGVPWEIACGVVRLDHVGPNGLSFAGLALRGDLIGAETLMSGTYGFDVRALNDCRLLPWSPAKDEPFSDTLVRIFSDVERRAEGALALRCGEASDRMRSLFRLLAGENRDRSTIEINIPSLKDMAEMTGLSRETASRTISHFIKSGLLIKLDRYTGLVEVDDF